MTDVRCFRYASAFFLSFFFILRIRMNSKDDNSSHLSESQNISPSQSMRLGFQKPARVIYQIKSTGREPASSTGHGRARARQETPRGACPNRGSAVSPTLPHKAEP